MFDGVIANIVATLSQNGVNAVRKYPSVILDRSKAVCCVSIRSARISSSGCGNYIGLCLENGQLKEMLGSKGELDIGLDIYSPTPRFEELKQQVCTCLAELASLNVRAFEVGEVSFDGESGMYRCECTANAVACLVRQINDLGSGFDLEEG